MPETASSPPVGVFKPGLSPTSQLAVVMNDRVGPGLAHLVYRATQRRRDMAALEANRHAIPLKPIDERPLVSVRIATYNRSKLLVERALPTVLSQSYDNLEVVIVGDHCTDDTDARVRDLGDPRVRFENLTRGTPYPRVRRFKWRAIGTGPWNAALDRCRGDWIATMDDDDEFSPDHVETLLAEASRRSLEVVFGNALRESPTGAWEGIGSMGPPRLEIHHSCVLYSARLGFLRYSPTSWLWLESADTNMWYRFGAIGARIGHVDRVVARAHFGGLSTPRAHLDRAID